MVLNARVSSGTVSRAASSDRVSTSWARVLWDGDDLWGVLASDTSVVTSSAHNDSWGRVGSGRAAVSVVAGSDGAWVGVGAAGEGAHKSVSLLTRKGAHSLWNDTGLLLKVEQEVFLARLADPSESCLVALKVG